MDGERHGMSHATVTFLRAVVGKPLDRPTPDELNASIPRLFPSLPNLEAAGWIAWCIVGLDLFAEGAPAMPRVRAESKRLIVTLAMLLSEGNLTVAARTLGTSRRVLREGLRGMGLYPWREAGDESNDEPNEQLSAAEPNHEDHDRDGSVKGSGLESEPGELPDVVEDDRRGVVWFKLDDRHGIGPAWLKHGDQCERLFRGWWVDPETVEAYALEHGHQFRCDGAERESDHHE